MKITHPVETVSARNTFIDARESPFFMFFFRIYTKFLFKRRFRNIYLLNNYTPTPQRSSLYYMNHASWWDALIPFLLNEYLFRQHARAMMDIRQLRKYPFFRKIGVYSVDRKNARSALFSLAKTKEWLQKGGNSIYLFPQGSIKNEYKPLEFEHGIGWLARECKECDIVPLAIHINHVRGNKPDLFLMTGRPVPVVNGSDKKRIAEVCRIELAEVLHSVREHGFDEEASFPVFL
ncbi:MAG: lysophospholipid acyltransferase family protein [Cyclonatronaceae bacterium]